MIKIPVKFQKVRSKTVGVALTKYLLQTQNHAPRITHHAPRKAEYHDPSLFFFEKAGGQKRVGIINILTFDFHPFWLSVWQKGLNKYVSYTSDGSRT